MHTWFLSGISYTLRTFPSICLECFISSSMAQCAAGCTLSSTFSVTERNRPRHAGHRESFSAHLRMHFAQKLQCPNTQIQDMKSV